MAATASPGKVLADALFQSLRDFGNGLFVNTNPRAVIGGVTTNGTFVKGATLDSFMGRATNIMVESGRVFIFGNNIVFEIADEGDEQLIPLASRSRVEGCAPSVLANLFCAAVEDDESTVQSLVPARLVHALMADEVLWRRLSRITHYGRRPVFDLDFNLCARGWNPAQGILLHGPDIEPAMALPDFASDAKAVDRLPPHLRQLAHEFCWRDHADVVHYVALLLTGLLINHFVDCSHPIFIFDGNQPSVGKTWLVAAAGRILDGLEPQRIRLDKDEELEKRLGAQVRDAQCTILFHDNVRNKIESTVLELNALSPVLSFRILGKSALIVRPNIYLWVITSNSTSATTDAINRSVPIRLHFEGNPDDRTFGGNPLEVASSRRLDILGELVGMVVKWIQETRPLSEHRHRCGYWAKVIGGILNANGLGEFFLRNVAEAQAVMDEGLQAMAKLAEYLVPKGPSDFFGSAGDELKGRTASDWVEAFERTGVLKENLLGQGAKGKRTSIGSFLAAKVDRPVEISLPTGEGIATLRMRKAGARKKLYWFECALDPSEAKNPTAEPTPVKSPATPAASMASGPLANGDGGSSTAASAELHSVSSSPGEAAAPFPPLSDTGNDTDLDWTGRQ